MLRSSSSHLKFLKSSSNQTFCLLFLYLSAMNGDTNTIPFDGGIWSMHAIPSVCSGDPERKMWPTNCFPELTVSSGNMTSAQYLHLPSGDPNTITFHGDIWSLHAMPSDCSGEPARKMWPTNCFPELTVSSGNMTSAQYLHLPSGDPNTITFHGDIWSLHAMPSDCSGDPARKMRPTNCFPELTVSSGNMTSAQYLQLQRLFSNDLHRQSNQTTYQSGTSGCGCNCRGFSRSPPSRRSVVWGDSRMPERKRNPFRLELDRVDKNPDDDKEKEEYELFRRLQNQEKYTSLEQVKGWMVAVAKTQTGSQFLKERCNIPEELETIFVEVKDRICELAKDPFGNDLVRCLLKSCNSTKRAELVSNLTRRKDKLFDLSLHIYGTRIVQELVDTIKTEEEISLVRAALRPRVVILMKDDNGYHVVKRWLAKFKDGEFADANNFLIDAVGCECVGIANHPQGHAIMRACLDCAKGKPKEQLINAIIANAPCLSEGQYGNYVVQHVLSQKVPWIIENIVTVLKGQFVSLSRHMFGSNVVESCMKFGGEKETTQIIIELLKSPHFLLVLNDPYGNYVAQTALECSKGYVVHNHLLNCVLANKDVLSDCEYGKNVLSKVRKLPLSAGKCFSRRQICRKSTNLTRSFF